MRKAIRRISAIFFVVCSSIGAAAFLPFIASFAGPSIGAIRLYRLSQISWSVGLGAIFISLLIALSLTLFSRGLPDVRKEFQTAVSHRRHWRNGGSAVLAILLVACLFPEFRLVSFTGSAWMSIGWSGRWAISEATARQHMWGAIRLSSVFLLISCFNTAFYSLAMYSASRPVMAEHERKQN